MEGSEAKVIPNAEGNRTTPSVVAFTKSGERLVGQVAKRQSVTNPKNTVFSIKRFMGRKYAEVNEEMKMVPYEVERAENGDVRVIVEGKKYSPPEISAMILGKLKQAAEDYLGEKVDRAVITVPAYFNDAQRQASKSAGCIAGLQVERLVNEPTAAALAYGLDKTKDQTIAVYDFGGGTFDISILEVGEGVVEVKSTNGDTHLGGDNVDQRIMEWLLEEFKKDQGINLGNDPMAMQRLKEAAEKAKIELSSVQETDINLPFITADASGPKHLNVRLARPKLEQLVDDLIQRSIAPSKQAMKDAGLEAKDIDEVVLVGGQTRMPAIQKLVKDFFGKEPHKGVNPDEVVAIGAAIQGGVLAGDVKDVLLLDVTPLSLGIETLGGVFTKLIERNTTITASSGLKDQDIERMVKEAESHRSEDQERRKQVEARNKLDSLVYATEKTYDEHKEKLGPDEKGELERALADAKKALEGDDSAAMDQAAERLTKASHKLAEVMYRQQQAGGDAGAAPGGGPGAGGAAGAGRQGSGTSDEVIDAEYVEK